MAASIVSNKIQNQMTVIEKWNWEGDFDWKSDYFEIEKNFLAQSQNLWDLGFRT